MNFLGVKNLLGQTYQVVNKFGGSATTDLGVNILGVPKRNGVRTLWEIEDPFGVHDILAMKSNSNL